MTSIEGRRKTIYGVGNMKLMDIQNRAGRGEGLANHFHQTGADVLPWIEKYTTGDFYLSDYTVGFADDYDLMMFNLAFKQ